MEINGFECRKWWVDKYIYVSMANYVILKGTAFYLDESGWKGFAPLMLFVLLGKHPFFTRWILSQLTWWTQSSEKEVGDSSIIIDSSRFKFNVPQIHIVAAHELS